MYLCLRAENFCKGFENPVIGKPVCFDGSGNIKAAAIYRMSKSRYRIYVILDDDFIDVLFKGIGAAVHYLQGIYDTFGK